MSEEMEEDAWEAIFIYFYSPLSTSRDEIEDAIDELLGDKGEVVGGGSGVSGSNIDVEIYEGQSQDFLEPIRNLLQELEVPRDSIISINQTKYPVYDEEEP